MEHAFAGDESGSVQTFEMNAYATRVQPQFCRELVRPGGAAEGR